MGPVIAQGFQAAAWTEGMIVGQTAAQKKQAIQGANWRTIALCKMCAFALLRGR